ncbi:TetR/AcrR family transcriptional regulator [uncultured Microbacterium sp.]|uniref:Regulatory protein TetR n=1 Tax=uncultured Microbacterium sp. TaxID=191216 RepID=A0A1Y5NYT4_9MICO|nr:TetR/AcrR family transcriptional regulator [uncultured Microbacterium sp.]SBS71566.1 Regulatory protein TetR [uncultured Microbacterium sp.]
MIEVSAKPGSRRREQTRARLLDAAHEVFGDVGMAAASVEAICERAGFTRGAFYSNFESKEELFLALITQLSEDKLEQVAGRVRELASGSRALDATAIVDQVVGVSLGDRMEPQLIAEIRVQALRDPRMAAAYLAWQDSLRVRVEQIIEQVIDAYGVRLRLPVPDAAQLLLDLSDDTCTRAAMEGRTREEIGALLNARLERLVVVLVEAPAV